MSYPTTNRAPRQTLVDRPTDIRGDNVYFAAPPNVGSRTALIAAMADRGYTAVRFIYGKADGSRTSTNWMGTSAGTRRHVVSQLREKFTYPGESIEYTPNDMLFIVGARL